MNPLICCAACESGTSPGPGGSSVRYADAYTRPRAPRRRAQPSPPLRTAASRRRLRDRVPELAGEAWIRERAAEVRDDPPPPVENVRLRHLGDPVAARDVARAVREHRERQRVRTHEAPRVGVEVVVVDTEEDDAPAAVARPVTLEHGCLALARIAPRRPEVQHDRLPPVGGQ